MSEDRRQAGRWWEAVAPATPTELGFVRVDRVSSTGDWEGLPREQAIARRAEYLKLVESIAEGFAAVAPLAWQGDGAMIFVSERVDSQTPAERRHDSVAATAGVLAITLNEQLLRSGFTVRIAAHTARVPFDAETGRMADPEIDRAGHLEHDSPPGAAALSEDVYLALPGDLRNRCGYLGTTMRDGTVAYVFPSAAAARRDSSRFMPAGEDLVPIERRFLRYLDGPDVRRLRYVGFRLRRPDPPSLDILDVFTPLDAEERGSARERLAPLDVEAALRGARLAGPWRPASRGFATPRPFLDVFATAKHLVVLGDPGSGKSTLLRWLAVNAGLGRSAARRRLGVDHRLLPLLLPVGRLAELRGAPAGAEADDAVSVLDVIVRYFRERNVGDEAELLRRLLRRRLEEGSSLVLLDGLDEVPSETRQDLARWLESFAAAYRENRFVVTSRLFGYAGMNLPAATTVVLRPFTDEQVHTYLMAWHRAYRAWESDLSAEGAELDRPAADTQAEQLVRIIRDDARLAALATNPFLLSAIALVHRAEGQLPTHRVQLYEIFSRALCETWDEARRLAAGERRGVRRIEYETEAIPILGRLALWLHERHPAGAAPDVEVRETIVTSLIEERGVARSEAEKAAEEFLRRAGEDLQILVPRGPGLFGFMHLTFQEFFAAAYLHARERFDAESRRRWYDPRWEEVILLGVGMLAIVQKRPAAASTFVRDILSWSVPEYPFLAEILEKPVCLAARCAADGPNLDVEVYEAVADALVRLVVRDPYQAKRDGSRRVLRHMTDTRFGGVILSRLLQELQGNPEPPQRADAAAALGALRSPLALDVLVNALREDPVAEVRRHAAHALGGLGDPRAVDALLPALREGPTEVRRAAADALGPMAPARVLVTLAQWLKDEDALTRGSAARALGAARARGAVDELLEILEHDPEPFVRGQAAEALGALGDSKAVPALIASLREDPEYEVRADAASSLGGLGDPRALDVLLWAVREDSGRLVRCLAAHSLCNFYDPGVLPALISVLQNDPDDLPRGGAAWALGWFRRRAATAAVVEAMTSDASQWVRKRAAWALGEHRDSRHREVLLQALRQDADRGVRAEAARALGQLDDLQVLQPLLDAFRENTDEIVRDGIVSALWALSDRLSWVPPEQASVP